MRAQPAAVAHPPVAAVVLVGLVGPALDLVLFFQAALGLFQPVRPRLRDRLGLLRAALIEAALGVAQPALAALTRGELRRQLVAARIAEPLVLLGVDGSRVFEDLARDLLVAARRALRRIGVHLRAVDRDHPDADQAGLGAEREHLAEQPRQRASRGAGGSARSSCDPGAG